MSTQGTYYVTYKDGSPYDTISGVTDISKATETAMTDGRTYRNTFFSSGNVPLNSASTVQSGPSINVLGDTSTPATFDAIEVFTTDTVPANFTPGVGKASIVFPDNVKHVAPRFLTRSVTYIVFTITGGPAGDWKLRIPESLIRSIVNEQPPSTV